MVVGQMNTDGGAIKFLISFSATFFFTMCSKNKNKNHEIN